MYRRCVDGWRMIRRTPTEPRSRWLQRLGARGAPRPLAGASSRTTTEAATTNGCANGQRSQGVGAIAFSKRHGLSGHPTKGCAQAPQASISGPWTRLSAHDRITSATEMAQRFHVKDSAMATSGPGSKFSFRGQLLASASAHASGEAGST